MTVLFPSSPDTHGTQIFLHNIHVQATFLPAFLMQGLFQKVSIERALSMILAFLLASIIFVDLHIFNLGKLVYRVTNGMTNSCRVQPEGVQINGHREHRVQVRLLNWHPLFFIPSHY